MTRDSRRVERFRTDGEAREVGRHASVRPAALLYIRRCVDAERGDPARRPAARRSSGTQVPHHATMIGDKSLARQSLTPNICPLI